MLAILTPTEAEQVAYNGRTEIHGDKRVPAVSFRLKFASVPNTWLDMISKTLRHAIYEAVPGQEQLEGVEPATPVLRSRDIKHLKLDNVYEGWRVMVEHGIGEDSALVMGSCKLDGIEVDLYEGGHIDMSVKVGTADLDRNGAGVLWANQMRKVKVTFTPPKPPEPAIDGSKAAFEKDYSRDETPDRALQADLLDAGGNEPGGTGEAAGVVWPFATSIGGGDGQAGDGPAPGGDDPPADGHEVDAAVGGEADAGGEQPATEATATAKPRRSGRAGKKTAVIE